jgi:hypothetical protein
MGSIAPKISVRKTAGVFQIVANGNHIFQTGFVAKPLCREERGLE